MLIKITKIKCGLTINTGNYNSERIDLEADLENAIEIETALDIDMNLINTNDLTDIYEDLKQRAHKIATNHAMARKTIGELHEQIKYLENRKKQIKQEIKECLEEVSDIVNFQFNENDKEFPEETF